MGNIKATYRKIGYGEPFYVGVVKVYENKKFLWSITCEITRLTKKDAILDAFNAKKDLIDSGMKL